jgi:hypothetical protein
MISQQTNITVFAAIRAPDYFYSLSRVGMKHPNIQTGAFVSESGIGSVFNERSGRRNPTMSTIQVKGLAHDGLHVIVTDV